MATGPPVYKIGGVSVYFPCKPYPSQLSMMDKIIKGIERRQNCLLESPTGSGKSLALLCSALGWQAEQLAKRDEEEALEQSREGCCCQCHLELPPPVNQTADKPQHSSPTSNQQSTCNQQTTPTSIGKSVKCDEEEEDDDFKDSDTSFRTPNIHKDIKKQRKHVAISYENDYTPTKTKGDNSTECCSDQSACKKDAVKIEPSNCDCCWKNSTPRIKVPKIYFGTRTHKQVSQIVRELKKTAYHDVRMTILGSREYTCIHPAVSKSSNKNEGCSELLKGPGCRFKDRTKRLESQTMIKTLGLETGWDLEDLVGLCKSHQACPYFLSRGLKVQSDLIICPYNYLIDPLIRDSMELNLKDQIIILDEAHNIEDSSREAASQTVHLDILEKTVHEIDVLIDLNVKVGDHLKLKQMAGSLIDFINRNSLNLEQKDFEQSCKIWSGFDIIAQLDSLQLGPKHFPDLNAALVSAGEELDDNMKQRLGHDGKLTNTAMTCFEQIFLVLKNMYKNDMKFVEDYRASLLKSITYSNMSTNGHWLNPKQRRGNRVPVVTYTLNFWCMSPAVAFSDFGNCRCVVLTSGTLSPMSSFQSELGLSFPIQLEANHVIKDNQVWVGSLGQGPTGTSLQAVYKNVETFTFQDELGQLILKVCQTVPNGVLCFFPSYKVLEKLTQRWQMTGLWMKLRDVKIIISEPRGKDKDNFEDLMKQFYDAADGGSNNSADNDEGGCFHTTGALFFAVCRGKVSEGLDFADNFARAVISVGIPYPNFKDLQVELKRKYNDQHRVKKGLLSGGEWYEIQAFRALNQALGRCIRHRRDWGSLILVDDRFVQSAQKYCKGLSKWVRNKVRTFNDFKTGLSSLTDFIENRVEKHEQEYGPDTSLISCTPTTPGQHKTNDTMLSPNTPGAQSCLMTSLYSHNRSIQSETPKPSVTLVKPNDTLVYQAVTPSATITSNSRTVTPLIAKKTVTPLIAKTSNTANLASIFKIYSAQVKKQNMPQAVTPSGKQTNNSRTVTMGVTQQITMPTNQIKSPNDSGVSVDSNPIAQNMANLSSPSTKLLSPNSINRDLSLQNVSTSVAQSIKLEPLSPPRKQILNEQMVVLPQAAKQTIKLINIGSKTLALTETNVKIAGNISKTVANTQQINSDSSGNLIQIDKEPSSNKFFKFCKIPNSDKSTNMYENKTKTCGTLNSVDQKISLENDKTPIEVECMKVEIPNTPPLFDVDIDFDDYKSENYRKPLFKRKSESESVCKDKENVEIKSDECENKANSNQIEAKTCRLSISNTNSKHQLIQSAVTSKQESNDSFIQSKNESSNTTCHVDKDNGSDVDESLSVRRNSRMKRRRSAGNVRIANKKPKGVEFLEDIDDATTEEIISNILCSGCGKVLVRNPVDLEKRMRVPPFFPCEGSKQQEVIYLSELHSEDFLKPLSTKLGTGPQLNSLFSMEEKVCVNFLTCFNCFPHGTPQPQTFGCQIISADASSKYKTGQAWLLSKKVKLI